MLVFYFTLDNLNEFDCGLVAFLNLAILHLFRSFNSFDFVSDLVRALARTSCSSLPVVSLMVRNTSVVSLLGCGLSVKSVMSYEFLDKTLQ